MIKAAQFKVRRCSSPRRPAQLEGRESQSPGWVESWLWDSWFGMTYLQSHTRVLGLSRVIPGLRSTPVPPWASAAQLGKSPTKHPFAKNIASLCPVLFFAAQPTLGMKVMAPTSLTPSWPSPESGPLYSASSQAGTPPPILTYILEAASGCSPRTHTDPLFPACAGGQPAWCLDPLSLSWTLPGPGTQTPSRPLLQHPSTARVPSQPYFIHLFASVWTISPGSGRTGYWLLCLLPCIQGLAHGRHSVKMC